MDGDHGVHAAGLQHLFDHLVGAEDDYLAAAALDGAGGSDQGAQSHRSEERDFLQIHQHGLLGAGDDVHAQIDGGGAFDVQAAFEDHPRNSAFQLFCRDRHFFGPQAAYSNSERPRGIHCWATPLDMLSRRDHTAKIVTAVLQPRFRLFKRQNDLRVGIEALGHARAGSGALGAQLDFQGVPLAGAEFEAYGVRTLVHRPARGGDAKFLHAGGHVEIVKFGLVTLGAAAQEELAVQFHREIQAWGHLQGVYF